MTEDRPHAKAFYHRTGLPEIDLLIDVHEAEQRHLDGILAVGDAESTVVAARVAELKEQQKAPARGWTTAIDQLATAEKTATRPPSPPREHGANRRTPTSPVSSTP